MARTYRGKLGTLRGASEWEKLESAGDVRRLLAWCIHSIRDQKIDPKVAAIMAQIGAFLLKAVEVADVEEQLAVLKQRLDMQDESRDTNGTSPH